MSTNLRRGGMRRGTPGLRLRAGFLVIAFVLSVFGARLIQLQAVDPGSYAAMAAREGSVSIVLPATRGSILDRNGQPLAQSASGLMIVADPTMTTKNAGKLAAFLTRRLGVDYFTTLNLLRTENSRFVYIDRQVPSAKATAVVADADSHGWGGLFTNNDPLRVYPQKDVAANLVGFLGTPNDDGSAHPLAGLEASFNTLLSGKDGSARYEVGAGNEIPLGNNTTTPAVNGQNLTTTLDANMQFYTQRVLQQAVRGAAAKSGIAIVMDTRTGQLLALADYPTYDASLPGESRPELYKSAALTNVYEPGSVQKTLTLSALMDSKPSIGPGTRLRVPGAIKVEDRTIHDYWPHGLLNLTLAGVIAKSSNVGTVLASSRLNASLMRHYLTEFGQGQRTGLGLDGESPGILPPVSQWTQGIKDRIAFGQSLSVTALQQIAAVNTIANGGEYISPSLVLGSATNDLGQTVGSADATVRQVIAGQTAQKMTHMMERVVDPDAGVAPLAQVPGYVVAGKTGTAQEVGRSGRYDSTTVSFAGFAPADNPRFTIYVVINSPRAGSGGGSTAGPVFSKLMAHALARYGVAPSGAKASKIPVEW